MSSSRGRPPALDAATRWTCAGGVAYTWDERGNLRSDGTFTSVALAGTAGDTWNAAGRLTATTDGTTTVQFGYDGDGNRLARQVEGGTLITYTLDVGLGLPEAIAESRGEAVTLYLHLPSVIAWDDGTDWHYGLADHLGSLRQVVDDSGAVESASGYRPFGAVLEGDGGPYGFTGEWTNGYIKLVFLRARWYQPKDGRFLSQDTIVPDFTNPPSIHRYSYVGNNPVRFVDPSGQRLSPEPIHAMIQVKFMETHGLGHDVHPEFDIPGGSKTGLNLNWTELVPVCQHPDSRGLCTEVAAWLEGTSTGNIGYADIVDRTTWEAFEIKNERDLFLGLAEINWYVSQYNMSSLRGEEGIDPLVVMLRPGTNYTWSPGWELIGTNPYPAAKGYMGAVIVANMQAPGVITYKSEQKDDYFRRFEPKFRYVWDWDPATRTVKKRQLSYVPTGHPCPSPSAAEVARDTALIAGGLYAVWRVGKVVVGFIFAGPPGAAFGAVTP